MRALFFLAMFVVAPVASADEVERLPFAAPVAVAADGTVTVGDMEGIQGPLAEAVRGMLGKLPFVPGRLEGVAVDSQVFVDGVVALHPVGDEFQPKLESVETHPLLQHWRPADYPFEMLRARKDGVATLVLQVGADGRIEDIEVVSRTHRDIAKAARAAAYHWRFAPQGAGFQVGATFWAHGNATESDIPAVDCPVPVQLAHLPGDDGCLRISETTGLGVRRGDPVVPVRHLLPSPAPRSASGQGD